MLQSGRWLVYTIGLEPLVARALRADLAGAVFRARRPLRPGVTHRDGRKRPDLVLIDTSATSVLAELAAAWAAWGERVTIVGIGRCQPFARVWHHPEITDVVEVGPGFLAPFLPAERRNGHVHPPTGWGGPHLAP